MFNRQTSYGEYEIRFYENDYLILSEQGLDHQAVISEMLGGLRRDIDNLQFTKASASRNVARFVAEDTSGLPNEYWDGYMDFEEAGGIEYRIELKKIGQDFPMDRDVVDHFKKQLSYYSSNRVASDRHGHMMEAQRASEAVRDVEKSWAPIQKYMQQEIERAHSSVDNPMGVGDMRLRSYSDAYIRAMSLKKTLDPMEQSVAKGQQRTKQWLRSRKIDASSSVKNQLIRLGEQKPELQSHIKPVLDHILSTRTSGKSLQEKKQLFPNLIKEIKKMMSKYPDIALGRVAQHKADLTYTSGGEDFLFHVQINPDANIEVLRGNSNIRTIKVQRLELWRVARAVLDAVQNAGRNESYDSF